MPAVAACPTDEQLLEHALGQGTGSVVASIASHLVDCAACRKRVAAMVGNDSTARPKLAHADTILPERPSKAVLNLSAVAPKIPAADLPSELLNHPDYTDIRELGHGGMGVVYLAQHKLLKRWEVLKVMGQKQMSQAGSLDRFLQEVQSAARLQHPNVVKAYTATRLGDSIAFAMEYVPGDDLSKVVQTGGPLGVKLTCFFGAQVAQGLQHAHEKGMVHRDIKPANLILMKEGNKQVVKILDFGLAKVTSENSADTGLTGDGQMMGTPDYMSPEQSLDAAKADIRADIYSLGVTLYYLLTGISPFRRTSLLATLQAHQTDAPRPVNEVRPEVPAELAAVIAKMLAKKPAERYQTPKEVSDALIPILKAPPAAVPLSIAPPEHPSASALPISQAATILGPSPSFTPAADHRENLPQPSRMMATADGVEDFAEETPKRSRPWLWPFIGVSLLFLATFGAVGWLWHTGVFNRKSNGKSVASTSATTPST